MSSPDDAHAALRRSVADYYGRKLAEHGATPRGVDWRDETSHRLRHQQFLRLVEGAPEASVADLGCGYGDFLVFLRGEGHRGRYIGYDLSSDMIAAAERLHGAGADRAWRVAPDPSEPADYVVASGIFNVKQDAPDEAWRAYMTDTVEAMARAAGKGFAFNALTSWSDADRKRPDLHYADPAFWFDHCARTYGRRVAVLQDYGLYEFTLICRPG